MTENNVNIYSYLDYRDYLSDKLPVIGPNRGGRAKIANLLACKGGFISFVLGKGAHFSLEHALKIADYLALSDDEKKFLFLLLQYNRAGSKDLENYFLDEIKFIQEKRKLISERIDQNQSLTETDQLKYYSTWYFTAIHMSLYSKSPNTRGHLARALNLSPKTVSDALDFLIKVGMVKQAGERYEALPSRMHLPHDSPLIPKHHTNWRMRAIQALDEPANQDLHYSLVMSLSESAVSEIRELILKLIQDSEPILKAAEDETVYCMNLDLFKLLMKS